MPDEKQYPSRLADRFIIRLPDRLRDRIKILSDRERISMNAWLVREIERAVVRSETPQPMVVKEYAIELTTPDRIAKVRGLAREIERVLSLPEDEGPAET
jgi:hypothetical protein